MIGAVDIGGTKIAVGVVDDTGRLLSRMESPTGADRGYPNALDRIAGMLRDAARKEGGEITGIGIGCTGPVYPCTGRIGVVEFLPGWEDKNPVTDLSQMFRVPVAMENDADAVALGEGLVGAAKGKASVICVTVGTGIGGGIMVEGRLYRGVDQSHPEIGHHVIDPSGPACFCGARGCWEVLARGPAMVDWLASQAPKDYPHLEGLTAKKICELAQQGDRLALQSVERETHYLGLGLANLVTLFSPEAIVLGGSVMRSAHLFLDGVRAAIVRQCGLVPFDRTELTLASLGSDAPLLGAAQVWHHRFMLGGGNHVQ
jgi:glucokinase